MSSPGGPQEVVGDLISFDAEPEVPAGEIAEVRPEPLSMVDALLMQCSEVPELGFNGTPPAESTEQHDLNEVINLLRLMGRFTKCLSVAKILATIEVLTGRACTAALLIEALQQVEAAEDITDGTLNLRVVRPDKYDENGYLINSSVSYLLNPVMGFDQLLRSQNENAVLIYDMELLSFTSPSEFVIQQCGAVDKGMNYLKRVDSVYWFPARKQLKENMPCLVADKEGDDLKRAIFLCSYVDGMGLFYLVDLDKSVVVSLRRTFLIPRTIFECYVNVYRARLAFVRPMYGSLWPKAVVDKVKAYLERRPFQVAFAGLEEDVMPVFVFSSGRALFEDLLRLPLMTFGLTELVNYNDLEALEVAFDGSVNPVRKLRETYLKNPAYFDVFESWYKCALEQQLYDDRGQLKIDSRLLLRWAKHFRRYFVGAFNDVSCKLNDSWYHECLKAERRLMATGEFLAEAHVTLDNTPNLLNVVHLPGPPPDELLCRQLVSLRVSP